MGNNRYRSGEFSGQWTAVKEQTNSNRIVSGALELSGTELSSEIVIMRLKPNAHSSERKDCDNCGLISRDHQ